jgi:polyadenylate-binding protein 2
MPTPSDPPASSAHAEDEEEESLEKLQAEIARMEEEAARIAEETANLERQKAAKMASATATGGSTSSSSAGVSSKGANAPLNNTASNSADASAAAAANKDASSIYIGQVDYSATPEELVAHFEACGTVERVTIVCDKFTGQPKGYAYLEFQTESAVENAVKLDGSTFKGRTLKVTPKRVNDPNFYYTQMTTVGGRGAPGFPGRGGYPQPPPPFRGGRGGRPYRGGFRGGYGGGYGYQPYY